MKLSTYFSICAVVCLAQGIVNGQNTTTASPTTTAATTPTTPTTNMTTAATTTTTSPTTPNNMTTTSQTSTPASNSTGTPSTTNATTTIPSTTPLPPTTTPPPPVVGEWTVTKPNSTMACMRMMFQGGLQIKGMVSPLAIPTDASANQSMCQSDDRSDFVLRFVVNGTQYEVGLYFVLQSDSKTSYMWNASVTTTNFTTGTVLASQAQVQVRFQAPMGKSYQCDQQSIVQVQDQFNITLSQMKLQPFASRASGNYGDPVSCQPKGGPSKAAVVGIVLGVIILALAIALVYECKKKKTPGRGYNEFS